MEKIASDFFDTAPSFAAAKSAVFAACLGASLRPGAIFSIPRLLRRVATPERLQPATFGELLDFEEHERRLVARARILVAATHFGQRRVTLIG
jgi:hypothetical protein